MSAINEIKKILHEASPAPWKWVDSLPHRNQGGFVNGVDERICDFGNQIDYYPTEGTSPSYYDELLIANAPEWLSSLITTIESLQGELKAADDHEGTLKHAFHVRQNINEKELYDKNKTIESQKEEIERLRFGITTAIGMWESMDSEDDPANVMDKVIDTFYVAKGYFLSQEGNK